MHISGDKDCSLYLKQFQLKILYVFFNNFIRDSLKNNLLSCKNADNNTETCNLSERQGWNSKQNYANIKVN